MIKKCQIEERLAVAIHNYIRSCRDVRTAEEVEGMGPAGSDVGVNRGAAADAVPAAILGARLLKAERRKILGGIESTFHKLGGDPAELQARLDAILIPGGARPRAEASSVKVSEFLERLGEPAGGSRGALAATNMTPGPERDTVSAEVDECEA